MNPLLQGILAGYGIAIPVGAIAILIVESSLRHGLRAGLAAGAGAASADIVYATLAALAGQALAVLLAPFAIQIRFISALALIAIGGWGVWQLYATRQSAPSQPGAPATTASLFKTYTRFVSLTLLNPLTVTYFSALILANQTSLPDWPARLAFVVGAGLASLSWQALLAGTGALAHRRLSPRFQLVASVSGNIIVALLGIRIFFQ